MLGVQLGFYAGQRDQRGIAGVDEETFGSESRYGVWRACLQSAGNTRGFAAGIDIPPGECGMLRCELEPGGCVRCCAEAKVVKAVAEYRTPNGAK